MQTTLFLSLMLPLAQAPASQPAERVAKHEKMLYTAVRVRTAKAGGSGTIIYSKPNKAGHYETCVLTNHHVVADAITVSTAWDSLFQKDIKRETKTTVMVEVFRYADMSKAIGAETFAADIVAYSPEEDLALLKMRSRHRLPYVAKLLPKSKKVYIYDETYAVGCSLGHDPISTNGEIVGLNDEIENKSFWMMTSNIISRHWAQ